jgi:hypothetical protein
VLGVIQLAQTADRWLTLRDQALTRLLNLTLFVTLFAVGAAFWFAGRMTLRISRLRQRTALAGREGGLAPAARSRFRTSSAFARAFLRYQCGWMNTQVYRERWPKLARDPHALDHHSFVL